MATPFEFLRNISVPNIKIRENLGETITISRFSKCTSSFFFFIYMFQNEGMG